jgi:hypothetical protein
MRRRGGDIRYIRLGFVTVGSRHMWGVISSLAEETLGGVDHSNAWCCSFGRGGVRTFSSFSQCVLTDNTKCTSWYPGIVVLNIR